jgi:hypothetical protein
LGDCGRYFEVQPRTFRYRSVNTTPPTCPHRPGSSQLDEMVENGAGRRVAQFGRFSWFCSEPTKMSDGPTGTILDHFVEWGRSRAVWTCRRYGTHAPVFTSTRFVCLNLGILLETGGRSPEVERDRWEIVGDIGRYNRVHLDTGACVPRLRHVHTARGRPNSTKWSRMAPVGASLSLVDFHGFARNRAK